MKLFEIRRLLECDVICGEELLDTDVDCCFATDMMSDVLAFSPSGALLVTGLATLQSVHAADIADLAAILFVQDKRPANGIVDVARQRKLPLLATSRYMFDTCGLLFDHGLRAAGRK